MSSDLSLFGLALVVTLKTPVFGRIYMVSKVASFCLFLRSEQMKHLHQWLFLCLFSIRAESLLLLKWVEDMCIEQVIIKFLNNKESPFGLEIFHTFSFIEMGIWHTN